MSRTRKVNYKDFNKDNLGHSGPETKDIKVKDGEPAKGKYNDLFITYLYDVFDSTGKTKIGTTTETLCIEGPPEVRCRGGVKVDNKKFDGKDVESRSSMFIFDNKNQEHKLFLEVIKHVYDYTVSVMVKFKGKLSLPHFSAQTAMGVLKYPVLTKIDKVTGEPVADSDPVMYLKVGKYSPFIGLDKKTIPIEDLVDTEASTIPLFKFSKVFIGQVVRFQNYLSSATVTDIRASERKSAQSDTVDNYVKDNQWAIEKLEEKLRQLRALRDNKAKGLPALENKSGDSENKYEHKNVNINNTPEDLLDSSNSNNPNNTNNNSLPNLVSIRGLPNFPSLPTSITNLNNSS